MKDPLLGKQLANFRIQRLLGQGGMATVYFGEDVKLGRSVALKVLDKRYRKHPDYARRFVNEARMMAKWRHENIIQIYYADNDQDIQYFVMEYVDGQDLSAVMDSMHARGRLMPAAEALRIGNAMAGALDYAHRHGVVHRDVKPSNILLSNDGRILLGDFGLALEVRDGSQGTAFGSPHYISPEQAKRSADAVPQSDLYSLGVILYEIFTGSVPFNDPSPESVALQHISVPPPAPRTLNPAISPAVETVLLRALAKNPRERYASGAAMMAALEQALAANSPIMELPPLPVGVPSAQPKRPASQKAAALAGQLPPTVRVSPLGRRPYWLFFLLLLAAGAGYLYFNPLMQFTLPQPTSTREAGPEPSPTVPPPPTSTMPTSPTQPPAPPQATQSPPTHTATPVPFTPTAIPTETFAAPTVLHPDGYPFSLIYNESSFYLLNRSIVRRSLSAFSFQRLGLDGKPMEEPFPGYVWEKPNNKNLLPKYCVSIIVYGLNTPYLNPPDCEFGIVGVIQPRFDRPQGRIFWTEQEGSTQFRVLWLKEEVARCQSADGWCDFFLP